MQAVILLTLVIIAGYLFKNKKSPYTRIIIGSIVGIFFFSVWPLSVYYIEIHGLVKNYNLLSYAVISIFALILSLFLIQTKNEIYTAIVTLFIFVLITVYSTSFESEMKNKISINTGYFDGNKPMITTRNNKKQRKVISTHNYTVSLDDNWKIKTDKGALFEYYLLFMEGNETAEFRPKCFYTKNISLPEIIKNVRHRAQVDNMKSNKYCYQEDISTYACKIISTNKTNQTKRIRWYSFSTEDTHGIELDFILFKNKRPVFQEIEYIIDSAKITNKANRNYNCLGLTEWM